MGDSCSFFNPAFSKPERSESVQWGGYSNFVPSIGAPAPAILYGEGGYVKYVDTQFYLTQDPRPANGARIKWHYTQNYNMQPHYGQQYPDRHPPGTNEANGRDFRRNRVAGPICPTSLAPTPQARSVMFYPTN